MNVYLLKDKNDEIVYIGATARNPRERWQSHCTRPGSNAMKEYLDNGGLLFLTVLAVDMTKKSGRRLEKALIHTYKPCLNKHYVKEIEGMTTWKVGID